MPYVINTARVVPEYRTATIKEAEDVAQSVPFRSVVITKEQDLIELFSLEDLQKLYSQLSKLDRDISDKEKAARAVAGALAGIELKKWTGHIDASYKLVQDMIENEHKRSEVVQELANHNNMAYTSAEQKYAKITKELGTKAKKG